MNTPGHISLRVFWTGSVITGVEIGNSRPQACGLLPGRTPIEAATLVPLLFSVCRHGQRAAAHAALAKAEGREPMGDGIAMKAEAIQEHLWRLLLDWPKALGLEPEIGAYAVWHRRLNEVATRGEWGAAGADLKAFCEHRLFGMDTARWLTSDGVDCGGALGEKMISRMVDSSEMPAGTSLLPVGLSAQAYYEAMAAKLDAGYARCPSWAGQASETGPYARWHGVRPVAAQKSRLAARLIARLAELAFRLLETVVSLPPREYGDAYSPESGTGFAVVETARGLLVHWVRLERGRIADYLIVAPTEWNFHPCGAFRSELVGRKIGSAEAVEHQARLLASALDPCAPYGIEVRLQ